MNFFEKILYFLQGEMNEPTAFGWFHIMCLILVLIMVFYLYKRRKYHNEKTLKTILGIYGIIALILEILKQLIWSFNYDPITNIVTWDYQWDSFPFQICTTPIYVSVICLFLKKVKIRDYLLSYMAYITILGSIATMIIPDDCFVSDILINIHTTWMHFGSFIVSVYLLMSGEVKINLESVKKASATFLIFVLIALTMNITIYNIGILNGDTFNMFYISPYFKSSLPVFDIIQEKVPYIIFLLIYIWALIMGSFIIYGSVKLIKNIFKRNKNS
ncbi:MAG: YwaF family protein [Bacilli bacterium]|nr:YwaF family protein [Bacilli bacterium]